ncbi:hypothetical protein STVA_03920 [Allostella vacuolata]|nr:hypothetical protein STVA_03920 [Stella vacuolata]
MFIKAIAAGTAWFLVPTMAAAHHAMDGQLPDSLMSGLLSGLGHPIIGWDHLAFVLGIGALSALAGLGAGPVVAFVAGTVAGCLFHVGGVDLPAAELAIALSLLGLAAAVALGRGQGPLMPVAMGLAGLFHGYAYGESIVGAEATPLVAYLVGFALIQAAIGLGAARLVDWLANGRAGDVTGLARVTAGLLVLAGAAALVA